MKKIAILYLLIPCHAFSADPFACVDPDFAVAFLGGINKGSPSYSTELAGPFESVPTPAAFSLLGSETSDYMTRAVFRSSDNPDSALSSAAEMLTDRGWTHLENRSSRYNRGFRSREIQNYTQFCRDSKPGSLTVGANDSSGTTFVSYMIANAGDVQSCAEQQSQIVNNTMGHMDSFKYLPILELPDDVTHSNSGMGGGGDEYNSRVTITSEISRAILVSHLDDQIRDQGWEFDTSWVGSRSSGSVWLKSTDGKLLVGTLHAYGDDESSQNVRFGLSIIGADGANSVGAFRLSN